MYRRNRNRGFSHPSITAAKAVQVNPIAIPIQGVCPSVPSLRALSDLVDPDDASNERSSIDPWAGSDG